MFFYAPTKVYSEKDCVRNHGRELAAYGTRALIVTGRYSAVKNGSLADVEAVLKEERISYVIFNEIEENPSVETVMRARELGIEEEVDFVIGIGGGSPLDAAKAIALMIANPLEKEDVLYVAKSLPHLPVICIPTTCGTGSEVTPYAILTLHEQRTKKGISHRIYPELALLDWKYLESMPREGLINTAVDALAHLIESYLNANSNEWNRTFSREGLRVWAEFKDRLVSEELLPEDYEKMLRASAIAGMTISHTGTSLPHGLSYTLTYELGIPHGRGVGLYLAGFLKQYQNKEDTRAVLELLGFEDEEAFGQYMKNLLGPVEVEAPILEKAAKSILSDARKLKNYPFVLTEQAVLEMFLY